MTLLFCIIVLFWYRISNYSYVTELKRVLVTMGDKCAALLKSYAAQWGMTQSDVLYECSRNHIHAQAQSGCKGTLSLLEIHDVKLDKRAFKECYGYP